MVALNKKEIRSSVLGVRLEEHYINLLENDAKQHKTTKSRITRYIIQTYYRIIKPRQNFEKITMGRNMFELCLRSLTDDMLREFSDLAIKNAIQELKILKFQDEMQAFYDPDDPESFYINFFKNWEYSYGSEGLGWLTSLKYKYNKEKNYVYLILTHDLNMKFSKFLSFHFLELFRKIGIWKWQVLDQSITETKLELNIRIIEI